MTTSGPLSASALAEVSGDGQKVVAIAVEYDRPLDASRLVPGAFAVAGRSVVRVHASDSPRTAGASTGGRFAIVQLSGDAASSWQRLEPEKPLRDEHGAPRGPRVGDDAPTGAIVQHRPAFAQVGDVFGADGHVFGASAALHEVGSVSDPVVDAFVQGVYDDQETGRSLRYNLFVPDGSSRGAALPLVLFMHDAGVITSDTTATLVQGLGAVTWATPEAQERHPAFVLAPQFDAVVVDDRYEPSTLMDTAVHLLDHVVTTYDIDRDRIYATGQSMGAMLTMAIGIARPGLFAAALIVGGQWPAELVRPLAATPLWVIVSEGDAKAFPAQNDAMRVLESEGVRVARARWDGRTSPEALAAEVRQVADEGAAVNYTTFLPGTVDASGSTDPIAEHLSTWRVAYALPGLRDWVMAQRR